MTEGTNTRTQGRGGRPPKAPEARRDGALWACVTRDEEAAAMRAAMQDGVSVSWWLRRLVLAELNRRRLAAGFPQRKTGYR